RVVRLGAGLPRRYRRRPAGPADRGRDLGRRGDRLRGPGADLAAPVGRLDPRRHGRGRLGRRGRRGGRRSRAPGARLDRPGPGGRGRGRARGRQPAAGPGPAGRRRRRAPRHPDRAAPAPLRPTVTLTRPREEHVMKVLVVYESMFGNSERVAHAVADGMRPHAEVELLEVDEAPGVPGADVDLLVAGGPTHAFSMSRERTREDAA